MFVWKHASIYARVRTRLVSPLRRIVPARDRRYLLNRLNVRHKTYTHARALVEDFNVDNAIQGGLLPFCAAAHL